MFLFAFSAGRAFVAPLPTAVSERHQQRFRAVSLAPPSLMAACFPTGLGSAEEQEIFLAREAHSFREREKLRFLLTWPRSRSDL